ncbi:hypothetical protein D3C75_1138670 [compost metagenome]
MDHLLRGGKLMPHSREQADSIQAGVEGAYPFRILVLHLNAVQSLVPYLRCFLPDFVEGP